MYKDELERQEQYKKYAELAYGLKLDELPKDKIPLYKSENKNNGFSAYSLKDGDRVVIVYKGTDFWSKKDWQNNKNMGIDKEVPAQAKDAIRFYDQMKEKYPNMKIDVVGHSLGGSLAQYVATQREVNQAVNFNPYGTGESQQKYLSKYQSKTPMDRIINYNDTKDTVSDTWSKDTQIGTNYSIETDKSKANPFDPLKHHWVQNMKPLSSRTQGNPSYDILDNKPAIKSAPKQGWDKHGNLTGFAVNIANDNNDYKPNNVLKYSGFTDGQSPESEYRNEYGQSLTNDRYEQKVNSRSGLDKAQQPLSIEKNEIKEPQNGIFGQTFPNISNPQQNGANGVNGVNINNFGDNDKLFPTGKSLHTGSSLTNNNPINTPSTTFDDLSKKYGIKNTPVSSPIFSHIPMSDLSSEFSQIPTTKQNIRDIIRNQSEKNDGVDISDYNTLSRNNSFGADNDNSITNSNKKFQDLDLEELLKRLWRLV